MCPLYICSSDLPRYAGLFRMVGRSDAEESALRQVQELLAATTARIRLTGLSSGCSKPASPSRSMGKNGRRSGRRRRRMDFRAWLAASLEISLVRATVLHGDWWGSSPALWGPSLPGASHAGGCGARLCSFLVTRASHVSCALSIRTFQFRWRVGVAHTYLYDFLCTALLAICRYGRGNTTTDVRLTVNVSRRRSSDLTMMAVDLCC